MKLTQHELMIFMNDEYRERVMGFQTAKDIDEEVDDDTN
jgi:hypothetical protein